MFVKHPPPEWLGRAGCLTIRGQVVVVATTILGCRTND